MRKIAISARGKDLAAEVDPRFGRAPYFVIYDLENDNWEAVSNPAVSEAKGAGIVAANFMADRGVEVVITGHCGPKAFAVLKAAGIRVATAPGRTVKEVISSLKEGRVEYVESPNVDTHFGGGMPGLGRLLGGGMGRGRGGG